MNFCADQPYKETRASEFGVAISYDNKNSRLKGRLVYLLLWLSEKLLLPTDTSLQDYVHVAEGMSFIS